MFNTQTKLGKHFQTLAESNLLKLDQEEVSSIFNDELNEITSAILVILRAGSLPDEALTSDSVFADSFLRDRGVIVSIEPSNQPKRDIENDSE